MVADYQSLEAAAIAAMDGEEWRHFDRETLIDADGNFSTGNPEEDAFIAELLGDG